MPLPPAPKARGVLHHNIIHRASWDGREAGVIVVFSVAFFVAFFSGPNGAEDGAEDAISLLSILISRAVSRQRAARS
jgi:hypothetical protein